MALIPRTLLLSLLQMVQRHLGVSGRDIGMALLAVIDCFFEMFNSFFGMWVGLYLLSGFGVSQRQFGVSDENIGMALLAVIDRFFGVADGFRDMVFGGQRNLRRQKQGESEAQHGGDESTVHG